MGKSILVVDDDPQLRAAIRLVLLRDGYDVAEAADGYGALQSVMARQDGGFDLVLTDIIMPGKEGLETILDLRRRLPRLKIIGMSGGGRGAAGDPLALAQSCGANFTIAKPFEPAALRKLVRLCLAEEEYQSASP